MKIVALIPARAGSKGIPKKNMIKIKNKPLIQFTVDIALKSKMFDEIIVSTNDVKVRDFVFKKYKKHDQIRILDRHDSLCDDNVPLLPVVRHAFICSEFEPDYICLLQPTNPLKTVKNLKESKKLLDDNPELLFSVHKVKESPFRMRKISKEGYLRPLLNGYVYDQRQDLPDTYYFNGAIVYLSKKFLVSEREFQDVKRIKGYVMSQKEAFDIDTWDDLRIARKLI